MVVMEFHGVELDYCVDCLGVWFDDGEVELLIETAGLDPHEARLALEPAGEPAGEAPRPCPLCGKKMEKVTPAGQGGSIILDRCRKGGGIWFDSREIIQTLSGLSAAPRKKNEIVQLLAGFLNESLAGE